ARLSRKCAASAKLALLHLRETISSHFDRLMYCWSLVGQRNAGNGGVGSVRSFRTALYSKICALEFDINLVVPLGLMQRKFVCVACASGVKLITAYVILKN
ncbi:hypothetical protein KC19_VG221000, partial [Ceratodon purpureus]